jgi:Tetratricopeptide repeat
LPANSRIEELTRRLEKEPGSRLFAQLAEELRKEGELSDAIRVCREGLVRHPNYPSARMTLGRALLDTGDLGGARAEFEAVLRAAPDNILASRFLAECDEGLGDLVRAEAQYKATLQLSPGDKAVMARLQAIDQARRTITAPIPTPDAAVAAPSPAAAAPLPVPALAPIAAAAAAVPAAPAGDPPPIPLVAADEEFEIERSVDRHAPTVIMRNLESRPEAAAPVESEVGPTVIMRVPTFEPPPPPPPAAPVVATPAVPPAPVPVPAAPFAPVAPVLKPELEYGDSLATARFQTPVPATTVAPAYDFAEETRPPVRTAPPPPPAPVPPVMVESPEVFTELDDEVVAEPEPVDVAPEPVRTERPTALGDASDPRGRAGLDTLFRFSALEEGELPPPPPPTRALPIEPEPIVAPPRVEVPPPAPVIPRPASPVAPPLPVPAPFAAPPPPVVAAPVPPVVTTTSSSEPGEIVSPTLAELYFSQGHIDKAIEVYRKLLRGGPENERSERRLVELEEMLRRGTAVVPAREAAGPGLSREGRRTATLKRIERLEQLLSVIQKR